MDSQRFGDAIKALAQWEEPKTGPRGRGDPDDPDEPVEDGEPEERAEPAPREDLDFGADPFDESAGEGAAPLLARRASGFTPPRLDWGQSGANAALKP